MLLHQRFIPGLAIASYIVGDEKSGEAAVIDPTRDVEAYIRFARDHDLHIKHIIETHVHADFVCGSRELKARLNDEATIHCSSYGGKDWTQPYADQHVKEGDTVEFGSVRLGFQHTPGHTPEHISVLLFDKSRSRRRRG
jgi:hydroxyacylglutathione hydrolase